MRAHSYRLPATILGAAVASVGATFLLRPRGGVVEPAAASATDYFTPAELQRARAFRAPQRALALGSAALEGTLLVILVARPPRAIRRVLERGATRPRAGAAAAAAVGTVVATIAELPLSAIAHSRARAVGLATQTWRPWLADVAKQTAIGAVLSSGVGSGAVALVRRRPRDWWLPAAGAAVALSALMVFAAPVVIDPIFNKFEPLPAGPLRDEVLELARRAGVHVGEVYRVDASRRTTGTNAYVWGLGATKRVVIYDTLIEAYPEDQVRGVIAHELSHVVHRDVQRSLAWLAIVAPAGALVVQALAERLNSGRPPDTPAALPALALAAGAPSALAGFAARWLSRRVERRADNDALELTRDPDAFIALTQSLVRTNVAEPSPPRVFQLLLGTHPAPIERIGAALSWSGA
jgi:STE24 endopeptidase